MASLEDSQRETVVAKWPTLLALVSAAVLVCADAAGSPQPRTPGSGDEWPLGLGRLESVAGRYPPAEGNAAAVRLTALAARIGLSFAPAVHPRPSRLDRQILEFLEAQIARADDRLDPLPADVNQFFRLHDAQLNAVRDLLIASPVAWPMDLERGARAPLPNLRAHTTLTRILVARALARSSWNDLRAAANLQRALSTRPELISQLVATSGTRLVLAGARKLPAPVPAWAGEWTQVDVRRGIIGAIQAEAWRIQQELREGDGSASIRDRLEEIIMKPFDEVVAGDYHELLRRAAIDLAASRRCAFDGPAFDRRLSSQMPFWNLVARNSTPDLGAVWQRVARLNAEREATQIVLALKGGRAPQLKSDCSDGSWSISREPSGATHLRFGRPIPVRPPHVEIPLEYVLR